MYRNYCLKTFKEKSKVYIAPLKKNNKKLLRFSEIR